MAKVNRKRVSRGPRAFLTKPQRGKAVKLYYSLVKSREYSPEKAFAIVMDSLTKDEGHDRMLIDSPNPIKNHNPIGRRRRW